MTAHLREHGGDASGARWPWIVAAAGCVALVIAGTVTGKLAASVMTLWLVLAALEVGYCLGHCDGDEGDDAP